MSPLRLLLLTLALIAASQVYEVDALHPAEIKRALRVIHRRPEFSRLAIRRYYRKHPFGQRQLPSTKSKLPFVQSKLPFAKNKHPITPMSDDGVKQPPTFGYTHALIDSWLQSLIPLSDVTILLPATIFTLATLSSDEQQNVLTYHIVSTRYRYRELTEIPGGTSLDTLQGATLIKRGPNFQPFVGFEGLIDPAQLAFPASLIVPNLWVGEAFTIHLISNTLTPPASE